MKRLAMIFVCLVVLLGVAFAESIDLSGYDEIELFALRQSIDNELFDRGLSECIELLPGKYVVGKDIDPGVYKIYCTSVFESHNFAYMQMYNDDTKLLENSEDITINQFARFRIEEGCYFYVKYGTVVAELIEE